MSNKVDEIRELLESKKDEVIDSAEDFVEAGKARIAELEAEINDVKESIGESVKGIKAWLKNNKLTLAVGAVCFFAGALLASLA